MTANPLDASGDAPVLVAVLNHPLDLARAREQHWYRIPVSRAPTHLGAEHLALYLTAAFPPGERWSVRWLAPVLGYHLTRRRELIPEELDHPRADERYYRIDLGPVEPLPCPVPSRRLRRLTFIRTSLGRLLSAHEINDLWIHTPAQARLWQALQLAGLDGETEHEYPIADDLPTTADFAVLGERGRIAVFVTGSEGQGRVREIPALDYLLAQGGWRSIFVDSADLTDPAGSAIATFLHRIRELRAGDVDTD